jgi:hypothetical protein
MAEFEERFYPNAYQKKLDAEIPEGERWARDTFKKIRAEVGLCPK